MLRGITITKWLFFMEFSSNCEWNVCVLLRDRSYINFYLKRQRWGLQSDESGSKVDQVYLVNWVAKPTKFRHILQVNRTLRFSNYSVSLHLVFSRYFHFSLVLFSSLCNFLSWFQNIFPRWWAWNRVLATGHWEKHTATTTRTFNINCGWLNGQLLWKYVSNAVSKGYTNLPRIDILRDLSHSGY